MAYERSQGFPLARLRERGHGARTYLSVLPLELVLDILMELVFFHIIRRVGTDYFDFREIALPYSGICAVGQISAVAEIYIHEPAAHTVRRDEIGAGQRHPMIHLCSGSGAVPVHAFEAIEKELQAIETERIRKRNKFKR